MLRRKNTIIVILIVLVITIIYPEVSRALEYPQIASQGIYIYDTHIKITDKQAGESNYNAITIWKIIPENKLYTIKSIMQLDDIQQVVFNNIDIDKFNPIVVQFSYNLEPLLYKDESTNAVWDWKNNSLKLSIKNENSSKTYKHNISLHDGPVYMQQLSTYLAMGLINQTTINNIKGVAVVGTPSGDMTTQVVDIDIQQIKPTEKLNTSAGVFDCYKIHMEANVGGLQNWLLYVSGIGSPFIGDYWVSTSIPHILVKAEEKLYGTYVMNMELFKIIPENNETIGYKQ